MPLPADDGTAVTEICPGLAQDSGDDATDGRQGGRLTAEETTAISLAPPAGGLTAPSDPALVEARLILTELQTIDGPASLGAELVAALNELVRLTGQ